MHLDDLCYSLDHFHRSGVGWAKVKVYQALVSYSGDEKKMEKAERAVEWKIAKKCKLCDVKEATGKDTARPQLPTYTEMKLPLAPKMVGGMVPRPRWSCFHCGELGHFRASYHLIHLTPLAPFA